MIGQFTKPKAHRATGLPNPAAIVCLVLMVESATAEPVKNIRSRDEQPLAVRGGVLMLPLTADKPGDHWPARLELTLSDQTTIASQVIWIDAAPTPMERQWTDDPRGLTIRPIQPEDESDAVDFAAGFGPYLIARLPANGSGQIVLGRQKLRMSWHDAAESPRDIERPSLERTRSLDHPDPDSPFEYWRWVLLADRLSMEPPPPAGSELEQLIARHYADLWQLGMSRLRSQNPQVAEQCRDMLTRTSDDRGQKFASWLSVPSATNALLDRLADFSRSDTTALADAAAWLESQEALYLWPVSEAGPRVRVAALAAQSGPVEARFGWKDSHEAPVAMGIEPGVFTLLEMDRVPLPRQRVGMPIPVETVPQVLNVQVSGRDYQLPFGARSNIAKPPAVFFRPLSPPLTLGEVQMHVQRLMPEDHQTLAQVRRLNGRWEVFIECRRPSAEADSPAVESEALHDVKSLDELRGIEAVTMLLGDDHSSGPPDIWLTVPEHGWHQLIMGEQDGTLQVHRKSLADRWYCRVVLPSNWLPHPEANAAAELNGSSLQISVARTHTDLRQIESGPGAVVPWRPWPARAAIDVSQWDDLPKAP